MKDTKRQILPTGLWIVATPIGNLADLTQRALWALQDADGILCEDTRRTSTLLAALGIQNHLRRLDAHTSAEQISKEIEILESGKSLALVTDAGTPSVSDPGSALVLAAHRAGIRVTPLPGASAVLTLLSASGFNDTPFTFRGFFPRKGSEQKEELDLAYNSEMSRVFVWFESPQRISEVLNEVGQRFPEALVSVGKELSKLHEKIFIGNAQEVASQVSQEIEEQGALGEWCFSIYFSGNKAGENASTDWVKALQCLLEFNISASESAKKVSQHFGIGKREVYEAALRLSGKK